MASRLFGYEEAWHPDAGRISSWLYLGNSSWLGRWSVGLWSLSSFSRALFQYGIRLPRTKKPEPKSRVHYSKCLTYLPTLLWNTKPQDSIKMQGRLGPERLFFQNLWSHSWMCHDPLPLWIAPLKLSSLEFLILLACYLEDPSVLDKKNCKSSGNKNSQNH